MRFFRNVFLFLLIFLFFACKGNRLYHSDDITKDVDLSKYRLDSE